MLPDVTGRTTASAAVDVGFGPVFLMVEALASHASERGSVAGVARAVSIELASQADVAGATNAAAAVDVGFQAVFSMVGALTSHAQEGCSVAGIARAIAIDATMVPIGAGRTGTAAAVDVSFGAVFSLVRALSASTGARYKVAGVGRAVGVGFATLPDGAGTTSAAAAVDVGFGTVLSLVHAQTTHALGR